VARGESLSGAGGTFLYSPGGYTYFDSLGIEAGGNVCVATLGASGISVVAPDGALVEFVPTPDPFTTNICWGGTDMRTAYVTLSATGRLATMRWPRPGLDLHY
jgi:gluconolactonase